MLLNYQQKLTTLPETDNKCSNIFILHGLFGSLSNLAGLANSLRSKHNIISLDLRNHGSSAHSASMTYFEMAADIFTLADHLNIENFSLVGHSMGGKVAMTCALLQPLRINKLVIVDIAPMAYPDKHACVFEGLHALVAQPIQNRKSADLLLSKYVKTAEVRQFLLKSLRKIDGKYQLQFNLTAIDANYASIRDWPTIDNIFNKETLFIKGGSSDYISEAQQTDITGLFPKAKIKVIDNTGHWLHAEKPKIFNRIVDQFLNYNTD